LILGRVEEKRRASKSVKQSVRESRRPGFGAKGEVDKAPWGTIGKIQLQAGTDKKIHLKGWQRRGDDRKKAGGNRS